MLGGHVDVMVSSSGSVPGLVQRGYLRSREFARYLDSEYAVIRAIMSELGLIK